MASIQSKPIPPLTPREIERFRSHIPVSDPEACWDWQGTLATRHPAEPISYGRFAIWRPPILHEVRASRIAYYLHTGEDPVGFSICHTCDRGICCNPTHLFKGTDLENTRDMIRKNRGANGDRHWTRASPERMPRGDDHWMRKHPERILRGERQSNAKLKDCQIPEIVRLVASGLQATEIGKRFGVSDVRICQIAIAHGIRRKPISRPPSN